MALNITSNVTATRAHSSLATNDARLSGSIERLSSGLRINRASDDAAGLAISEKLRSQIRSLKRAQTNVQDGTSMLQTAEGSMSEISSMLQRMRELALQSSNDTLTTVDRIEIQKEVAQLKEDINRIGNSTEFNTKKLLDGSCTALVTTSDPENIDAIVTGNVVNYSDFKVDVRLKTEYTTNDGWKTYTGHPEVQSSAILKKLDGSFADSDTLLRDIANFYDENGTFILEHSQTLYIQGDNSQASFDVNKGISVGQLKERILGAMTNDQLGNGLHFTGSTSEYSNTGETAGQIVVTSGRNGTLGRINFTGPEALVNALGFQVVKEPEDPIYEVSVTDVGVPVNDRQTLTATVGGNRVSGLIDGIDIAFEHPLIAHAEGKEADLGLTINTDINFNISDTYSGPNSVSIPAGTYSMNQIADIINTQMAGMNTFATIGSKGGIELSSVSDWIKIDGITPETNELGFINDTYVGNGYGKTSQEFEYDKANSTYGYVISGNAGTDDLSFSITDLNKKEFSVSFPADNTVGSNFVPIRTIVNEINNKAMTNNVEIVANFDTVTNKMNILSTVPGKDGRVVIKNEGDGTSANNISSVMGIEPDIYSNGLGNYAYDINLKNTKIQLQIGPSSEDTAECPIARIDCKALGIEDLDLTSTVSSSRALNLLSDAINKVSAARSTIGAVQNRLSYTYNTLSIATQNITASESRIRDCDTAAEVIEMTQSQILQEASNAMVAQANSSAQSVLQLLSSR